MLENRQSDILCQEGNNLKLREKEKNNSETPEGVSIF